MSKLINLYNQIFGKANYLAVPALLGARLYVAWVFFKSGLTKLNDWESTLLLFEYEYAVPVLDFTSAAYLATFGELVLPVLLALGLFTRKAAIGLFIVNYVAVISLEDIPAAAYNLHVIWGLMLLAVVIWGAEKLSLDQLFKIK
ncbi:DoxX family protein [Glaciecola petra]|uniref:DoxX family protein n=1 Tax=Glaciecola petra TaxID=3075602 RepID=A0ABU2ZME4_9ALTE|nr:DoxX family protein [Aestuariibacter sp. P117]MDT0593570.1 DoxX family protein [Aestuariibacter sp. P117]